MILSCSNIAKTFGCNAVLENVSFHIEEHEKAAIVGINGAGKSTLLKIIIGQLSPDEGGSGDRKGKNLGLLSPAPGAGKLPHHLPGGPGNQAAHYPNGTADPGTGAFNEICIRPKPGNPPVGIQPLKPISLSWKTVCLPK